MLRLSSAGVPSVTSLPEVDDAYAVSQTVGFFKIVGREEDCDAEVGVDATYFFPNAGSADGVEAGGGFV